MDLLRQCKSHEGIARPGPQLARAAGGDDDELAALRTVGRWGCVAAGGEGVLPEEFAGVLVEGVDPLVERPGDEDEAAGRDDGTAEVLGPRPRNAPLGQLGMFAQDRPPG